MLSQYDNWLTGFGIYEDESCPLIDTELLMEERRYGTALYNVTVDLHIDNEGDFTFRVLRVTYLDDDLGDQEINPDNLGNVFLGCISEDIAEHYLDDLIGEARYEWENRFDREDVW